MTNKLFTIAGISTAKGVTKYRFATGTVKHRTLVLTRNDHTDIKLFDLPTAMTKAEAKSFVDNQMLMTPVAVPAVATPQVPAIEGMTPLGIPAVEFEDALL